MLFNFRLTPLNDVPTWSHRGDQHLHWFGLTYGCYWLSVGDSELFRYREEALHGHQYDKFHCEPHVDYPVVRLWEDFLDILPSVLVPVPESLAENLAACNLLDWQRRVEHWMESKAIGLYEPDYEHATKWVRKRHLTSGHLAAGPNVWAWNDGTDIHIEWDNRELAIDGIPLWTADFGSWSLPVNVFLDEVHSFNTRLIDAMQVRVEQIRTNWIRPEVFIDKDELVLEQADRAKWLARSLEGAHQELPFDWDAVINAIARIEAETKI